MTLNDASKAKLVGVHPDLVKIITKAAEISDMAFVVTEGLRTLERQKQLMAVGASKTLNSRHITGHAVDLGVWVDADKDGKVDGGEIRWDWPLYLKLSKIIKEAALRSGIPLEWGGDWKTFKDGPHFQLPFSKYPG